MRLYLIGCEYVGTRTLGYTIHQWAKDIHNIDLGSIHAHWKIPYTIPHYPAELSDQEHKQILALSKPIIEANQRHSLYYHSPAAPADWDQLLIGYYIEDTIYSQLYYGYGGVGQAGDRLVHSKKLEERLLMYAPHTVLILVKATPDAIAMRMRQNPHKYRIVPEKDIELVLRRFEEEYKKSMLQHRFTLDTTNVKVEETLADFIEKMQPHLTPSDRQRMAVKK